MPKRKIKFSVKRFFLKLVFYITVGFVFFTVLLILPFRWLNPPLSSFQIIDAFNNSANPLRVVSGEWINNKDIPADMKMAVIAAEDQRFAEHHGLDLQAIWTAYQNNMQGGRLKGGSTITQQLAKNLFLWPQRSYFRKALEAWISLWLELLWPKTRILEVYLNIIEFGPHIFGIDAAAENFYHISAKHLTTPQCALLAAVLPSPKKFKVRRPSNYLRHKQQWILKHIQLLGGASYLRKFS